MNDLIRRFFGGAVVKHADSAITKWIVDVKSVAGKDAELLSKIIDMYFRSGGRRLVIKRDDDCRKRKG